MLRTENHFRQPRGQLGEKNHDGQSDNLNDDKRNDAAVDMPGGDVRRRHRLQVKQGKPDIVDIRPGVSVLRTAAYLKDNLDGIPIICSGFIKDREDIQDLIRNRVTAVTTSNKKIWDLYIS